MAMFEQTPSRSGSRFGKLSSNMFFTRNTAKPKRVRHIEGLNGALICNVNDDPAVVRSTSNSALGLVRPNLPLLETPRRVERLVPPMGFWNTYGVIHDTERWRHELASLANASGLGIQKDEIKQYNRQTATAEQQNASRSGAHYSARTGRFNEGNGKSRGRTGSKHATAYSDLLYQVPEHEREMWMLQVLCQLLGTSNLEDVQSWLVSASPAEKEKASDMINSALRGLSESERTSNQASQSVDLNSLSDFVDRQRSEERVASQKFLKESLNRSGPPLQTISEDPSNVNNSSDPWASLMANTSGSQPQNTTTYQHSYQNFHRRSQSALDTGSNIMALNEDDEDQQKNENNEQINPTQLEDDRQRRSRSISQTKTRKSSKQQLTPLGRSSSSRPVPHRIESIEINDGDETTEIVDNDIERMRITDENIDEIDEQNQRRDFVLPPIKSRESMNLEDDVKTRKIRELKTRLSRQEEESKKQINELQTKQSRLENAIKLLAQQQTPQGRRHQQNCDNAGNSNAFRQSNANEAPDDNARYQRDRQQEASSSEKQLRISNMSKNRDENQASKSISGVWKPDASTPHRFQGNS